MRFLYQPARHSWQNSRYGGLGLQFAFAIFVLRIDAGRRIFQ
jgi:hypothetical protein